MMARQMKIAIWANTSKQGFWKILPELIIWLKSKSQQVFLTTRIDRMFEGKGDHEYSVIRSGDDFSNVDFLLAMGGDGTILSAARAVGPRNTPILGVHVGGLGFLAEGAVENLYTRLESIINNDFHIFPRMVLEAAVKNDQRKVFYALNDLVVDRGESYRLMKCSLSMNGQLITAYSADGLIISTPTGSTAYNLAAGGPIVAPWLALFTVTPICPHTLSARPIVLPAEQELTITFPETESELRLAVDGQVEEKLSRNVTLQVRRAPYDVQMVTFDDRDYFHTLRSKLGWGNQGES